MLPLPLAGGKTYLFTGDAIYLDQGEWKTIVVADDGGDEAELARSLWVLRELEVDVVICSVSIGEMRIVEVTPDAWRSIIDGLVEG